MTEQDRILAVQDICALKARYFRMMDIKDWAGLEQVFTPDLVADFRDAAGPRDESQLTTGAALYVSRLAPMLEHVVTVHHGHTPEITIETADGARGIWAMEDKLWVGEQSALPFRHLHGYGHYHERYRRIDGAWRIAEVRLTRLHLEVA